MSAEPRDRIAATGLAPVGGGWTGETLQNERDRWRLPLPLAVADELLTRAGEFLGTDSPWDPLAAPVPVSPGTESFLAEVCHRLAAEPGFVVVTGFPVDLPPRVVEAAYWLFGRLIGEPVSQTRAGDFLVSVEDRGADITSPVQRGHRSASALPFHADRTDVIGLLCVRPATAGGTSLLASSRTLHDTVLAERPELLLHLYAPLPNDQRGEEQPGRPGWCPLPVFSRVGQDFAARYVRRFIEGSQRHPDAPRLTDAQRAAMDLLDEILARPGFPLRMDLGPGDLQLINNLHLLHARTGFQDDGGPGEGRLLLRLWLSFAGSPALPPDFADLYGVTAAGSYRGGVWPPGGRLGFGEGAVRR